MSRNLFKQNYPSGLKRNGYPSLSSPTYEDRQCVFAPEQTLRIATERKHILVHLDEDQNWAVTIRDHVLQFAPPM